MLLRNKELDDYLLEQNLGWTAEELDAIKRAFSNFVSDWLNKKRGGFQWKGTTRYRIKRDLLLDLGASFYWNKYKAALGLIVWGVGTVTIMYVVAQLLHVHILEPLPGVI